MWLPDWLYKSLPYLYALAGMLTINYFEVITGFVSGLLLILTAGLVFLMRLDYQKNSLKRRE